MFFILFYVVVVFIYDNPMYNFFVVEISNHFLNFVYWGDETLDVI